MKLNNLKIKKAQFEGRNFKLFDGHNLYLWVTKHGKYWRYRYSFGGKEKTLSLGAYPDVSLKMARDVHLEARLMVRNGLCPCTEKKRKKIAQKVQQSNTFEAIAREWYEYKRHEWTNEKHAQQVINTLATYIFPTIGNIPITDITALEILDTLNRFRDKAETCSRVKQRVSAVFKYAIVTGRADTNPVEPLPNPGKVKVVRHQPALPIEQLPEFFTKLQAYPNDKVKLGLRLLMLTFVRSSELRNAQWKEFKGNEWHIPAERMKMKLPHTVPLSDWALETLDSLKKLQKSPYVFPSNQSLSKPIHNNVFLVAMYQMGYKGIATPHGFRAVASSVLNTSGLFSVDAIERQLAHREKNAVRAAYNRADYLEQRHEMMQWYSDFLKERWRMSTH